MTIDEATIKALERYANLLRSKGYHPVNSSEFDWRNLPKTDQLNHACWMSEELLKTETAHYSIDKKSRWLGFIQCILIIHGLSSIKEERDVTRAWFTGKDK